MLAELNTRSFWALPAADREALWAWLLEHDGIGRGAAVVAVQLGEGEIVVTEVELDAAGQPVRSGPTGWDFARTERVVPSHRPPPVWV